MTDPITGLLGAPAGYLTLRTAMEEALACATTPHEALPRELSARVLSWMDPVLESADLLSPLWREIAASQLAFSPITQPLWGPSSDPRVRRRLVTLHDVIETAGSPREGQELAWQSMVLMSTGREARTTDLMAMMEKSRDISPFARDMAGVRTALLAARDSGAELGDLLPRTMTNLNGLLRRFTDEQIARKGEGRLDAGDGRAQSLTWLRRSMATLHHSAGRVATLVPDVCGTSLKQARATLEEFALGVTPIDAVNPAVDARQPRLEGGWVVLAQSPNPGTEAAMDTSVSVFFAKPKEIANPALLPQ
ncbi:MAG: PASTA domain-containing protein [Propionibacteriales bacterium]|nr:PASTA domain-containing protein [Propionibacteriales bacterium]